MRSCCGDRARCSCGSPPSAWRIAGVATTSHKPTVGYRETIKKSIVQRGRHKKQSGGHGQYGDVVLDIKPLPRGAGFTFTEEIGVEAVPRNYIPSVEEGQDALKHGPLGFPVVDIAAKLIDGSYHTVDPPTWRFSLPAGSPSTKASRSASRCCWSRFTRWRSSVLRKPRRR